jgi:RNA polymerase sigma factor (sigma-70 family)
MQPSDDETSAELLVRCRDGDEQAAEQLFERYFERLALLARSRLSPRLAARTDPEDVVLSAYRSFFIGVRAGRFSLKRSGDLWRLLVAITMHKLYRQAKHHSAEKRSVYAEQLWQPAEDNSIPRNREPTPEEAVALADELEAAMSQLDAVSRRVLELRLQGEPLSTIAAETGRSERTIRRLLSSIRDALAKRLRDERDA